MKFGKWITTNGLYIVTLKELVDIEYNPLNLKTSYKVLKNCNYTICKKKQYDYIDIFTNTKYKLINNTKQGDFGIIDLKPLLLDKKIITNNELLQYLDVIKDDKENNDINKDISKSKKLIPFSKKY